MVPEPLEPIGDTVNYKFIRMPDSTGFGDYTETLDRSFRLALHLPPAAQFRRAVTSTPCTWGMIKRRSRRAPN